ncbi:MAG: hypothetical protein ACM32O_04750, partial [Clostridia bacterium]
CCSTSLTHLALTKVVFFLRLMLFPAFLASRSGQYLPVAFAAIALGKIYSRESRTIRTCGIHRTGNRDPFDKPGNRKGNARIWLDCFFNRTSVLSENGKHNRTRISEILQECDCIRYGSAFQINQDMGRTVTWCIQNKSASISVKRRAVCSPLFSARHH